MSSVQPTTSPFESASTSTLPPRLDRPHGNKQGKPNDQDENSNQALDPRLVQETKIQIRTIVNEIQQLCQSGCDDDEFYEGFLTRVTSALASVGGAVWTFHSGEHPELRYQINLTQTGISDDDADRTRHLLLLEKVASTRQSTLVPPHSGAADDDEAGNPTGHQIVLATFAIDDDTTAIVEAFQRPGGGPTTGRGYLRFLVQMCELAEDYMKNCRLRDFDQRQQLWERLEFFIRSVHRSLDPKDTVFTIANEGRRLAEVDRVSVALCHGRKCSIEAVSGLDAIDRRAAEVKRLGRLAKAVVKAGEPLWYEGDDGNLPPQIEDALHQYVDRSHAKMVAVVPLVTSEPAEESVWRKIRSPVGALIVEHMHDGRLTESLRRRVAVVAQHSTDALTNAHEHGSLFLLPLWKTLGKSKAVVAGRHLPKTIFVLVLLAAVIGGLLFTPADFKLSADGTLQPKLRQEIFAPVNGKLVEVFLPEASDTQVKQGQLLARLENNDLAATIADLEGRRKETNERIISVKQMLLDDSLQLSLIDESRLDGELNQLAVTLESINRQLELQCAKQDQLEIKSPGRGQVVTWQARENLMHRPVQRGQRLMTLVDPDGPWQLEIHMPERRIGHLLQAARDHDQNLRVTFVSATHPNQEFEGRVVEISRTAEARGEEGNTVLVRVAFDKSQLPDLRVGAKVTAQVHCGERSAGFVLFQDLIETVHSKLIQWF